MRLHILQNKLDRYIRGTANPAEVKQVQTWLSCVSPGTSVTAEEKERLRKTLLDDIHQSIGEPFVKSKA